METDRYLQLPDGMGISYVETGAPDGDVILYMHGTPSSRMQVTGALDRIAADLGLRIVAPDRPGYGRSSFESYRVTDYPAIVARFADSLGIGEFGVVGTSGGGRYACACASAMPDRVRRMALVASTAPSNLPGVRHTWSKQDRRLYAMAVRMPWLLRALMAKTARDIRRDPNRMLELLPRDLSRADRVAADRPDVQAIVRVMSAEAFRAGGRGIVHDLRLEALPWGVDLNAITAPVDIWHGRDDTIVKIEQAAALADAIPGAHRHFIANEGHFSLVFVRPATYLEAFCT